MDLLRFSRGVPPGSPATQKITLLAGMVVGYSQTPPKNPDGTVGEDLIRASHLDAWWFGGQPWALRARTNIVGNDLPKLQSWKGRLCLLAISSSCDPECLMAQVFEHLYNRYEIPGSGKYFGIVLAEPADTEEIEKMSTFLFEEGDSLPVLDEPRLLGVNLTSERIRRCRALWAQVLSTKQVIASSDVSFFQPDGCNPRWVTANGPSSQSTRLAAVSTENSSLVGRGAEPSACSRPEHSLSAGTGILFGFHASGGHHSA